MSELLERLYSRIDFLGEAVQQQKKRVGLGTSIKNQYKKHPITQSAIVGGGAGIAHSMMKKPGNIKHMVGGSLKGAAIGAGIGLAAAGAKKAYDHFKNKKK